jgi:predicted DNA-binding transcriptional regulator AlpA
MRGTVPPNTPTNRPPTTSLWLNKSALARHLGVAVPTIDNWLEQDPRFPRPYNVGASKRPRWRVEDVEAYLALCREEVARG